MRVLRFAELLGALVLTALMSGIFVAAILKIGSGVSDLVAGGDGAAGVADLLRGIEYLFIAPLVLLAYVSVVIFLRTFFSTLGSRAIDVQTGWPRLSPQAAMLGTVKESVAALMIAILLTDLVDRALTARPGSWLTLLTACFAVILSGGYLLLMAHVHREERQPSRVTHTSPSDENRTHSPS